MQSALFSGFQCWDERQWAQIRAQEVPSDHQQHCAVQVAEHRHTLQSASHCKTPQESSIATWIWCGHAALRVPAGARPGLDSLQRSQPTSTILGFRIPHLLLPRMLYLH